MPVFTAHRLACSAVFAGLSALSLLPGLALAAPVATSTASTLAASSYQLKAINGGWAWGYTDWNAVSGAGMVNSTADLGKVQALLSDGYTHSNTSGSPVNGIYRWNSTTGGKADVSLEFAFNGGADQNLSGFKFVTSRFYLSPTFSFDYSLDGGAWMTASTTTAFTDLGRLYGDNASTYEVDFTTVKADAFRLRISGGDQVSLHELSILGAPAAVNAVPEPASLALASVALAGLVVTRRRRM